MSVLRRSTRFFTGRESLAVVQETRGLPFTVATLMQAFIFGVYGIRHIFFCGYVLPGEGQLMVDYFDSAYPDCRTNNYRTYASLTEGGWAIMMAHARLQMATTSDTAELYSTLKLVVVADTVMFFGSIRLGYSLVPWFYQGFMVFFLGFEIYLMLIARKAYVKRHQQQHQMKDQ